MLHVSRTLHSACENSFCEEGNSRDLLSGCERWDAGLWNKGHINWRPSATSAILPIKGASCAVLEAYSGLPAENKAVSRWLEVGRGLMSPQSSLIICERSLELLPKNLQDNKAENRPERQLWRRTKEKKGKETSQIIEWWVFFWVLFLLLLFVLQTLFASLYWSAVKPLTIKKTWVLSSGTVKQWISQRDNCEGEYREEGERDFSNHWVVGFFKGHEEWQLSPSPSPPLPSFLSPSRPHSSNVWLGSSASVVINEAGPKLYYFAMTLAGFGNKVMLATWVSSAVSILISHKGQSWWSLTLTRRTLGPELQVFFFSLSFPKLFHLSFPFTNIYLFADILF
jgi:hypothetical protein